MAFERPEHNIIAELLASMNQDVLIDSKCYFGGGTAIVLCLGYRELRKGFFGARGIGSLFPGTARALRDVHADATSVRLFLEFQSQRIKFEIVI